MKQKNTAYLLIRKAAKNIVRKFNPKKIILFGSYGRGHPTRESDVDLLVIFPNKRDSVKRYAEISKELEPRVFPIDLLVRSTQEIKHRLKIGDSFIQEIVNKGHILYES